MSAGVKEEAEKIYELLRNYIPSEWDGKKAILELKEADYYWRRPEWIGWYFESKPHRILVENIGGSFGPKYGRTQFDYKRNYVWDFKTHVDNSGAWAIINDMEAMDRCIQEYGGVGLILAIGSAEYDDEKRTFRYWHEQFKGGKSKYEYERIKRGATSRVRKITFVLRKIEVLCLT